MNFISWRWIPVFRYLYFFCYWLFECIMHWLHPCHCYKRIINTPYLIKLSCCINSLLWINFCEGWTPCHWDDCWPRSCRVADSCCKWWTSTVGPRTSSPKWYIVEQDKLTSHAIFYNFATVIHLYILFMLFIFLFRIFDLLMMVFLKFQIQPRNFRFLD